MHPTFISTNENCQGYIPFNQKRIILTCLNQDKPGRNSLMLLWFKDLINLTEEVTIHRPNFSTLLSSTFIKWQMARQKPSSVTAKNQLQLVTLLMKGSQRLVLLLFLTFRVLQNPSREFWIATTLKLLKKPFQTLWHIFAKLKYPVTKEQRTDAIYVIPCNDCDNEYIGQTNVSLVHVWKSIRKRFSFAKRKIQLYRSTHAWLTIQLGGIILKLSPLICVTTSAFVWRLSMLTPPTFL